jgi:hypothetical protein
MLRPRLRDGDCDQSAGSMKSAGFAGHCWGGKVHGHECCEHGTTYHFFGIMELMELACCSRGT